MTLKTLPASARPDADLSPTKRRVMHVAATLFAEKGYGSVGISEVGDAAELGKGALYYHIRSKEDLLYDIMTLYMVDLVSGADGILSVATGAVERVRALSSALIEAVFQTRAEMTVCFREVHSLGDEKRADVLKLHGDYQRIWTKVLSEGVEEGVFRPLSRVEIKGLLGMYFYAFLWVRPSGKETPEEVSDAFAGIVLKAAMRTDAA
ncbi:TetR/AcrR family transcriptional regulator [Aureimonas sp. AU4]|uniref:TetR/AcrR family transcriptional regulator n=1 Tax=Aureimonas sp. AU4 TaxID=1638163 RepID=UPI0007851D42|nr:TetR/AcrR family transcriptional regulator [Aureimonas sp. AU4]